MKWNDEWLLFLMCGEVHIAGLKLDYLRFTTPMEISKLPEFPDSQAPYTYRI